MSHITNPLANGKAMRWHGYAARLGLGMTLIRNHIRASSPVIGSNSIGQCLCRSACNGLPVLGQILTASLFMAYPFR